MLHKMSMDYFGDIKFLGADHIPGCQVHIHRRLPGLAINYLKAGAVYFSVSGRMRTILCAPALFWTWEGRRCDYGPVEGDSWDHYWIHAIGGRAKRLVEGGLFPDVDNPFTSLPPASPVGSRMEALVEMITGGDTARHDECVWLFEGIGVELRRLLQGGGGEGRKDDRLAELERGIAAFPVTPRDFVKEARRLGCSYNHFRRLFQRRTGLAPRAFQLDRQMRLAAARLARGEPVKVVALEMGYDNLHYFSRLFKAKIGLSPRRYAEALPCR